jgi:hypothetical protein
MVNLKRNQSTPSVPMERTNFLKSNTTDQLSLRDKSEPHAHYGSWISNLILADEYPFFKNALCLIRPNPGNKKSTEVLKI